MKRTDKRTGRRANPDHIHLLACDRTDLSCRVTSSTYSLLKPIIMKYNTIPTSLPFEGTASIAVCITGLSNLDIEELRTQIAAERLAREQGDDRCMENARDLVNEESWELLGTRHDAVIRRHGVLLELWELWSGDVKSRLVAMLPHVATC